MSRVGLEICVEGPAGAAAAILGGCDRIELCAALSLGGLTPSAGLVFTVLDLARLARVPVHAMVRPRPGGFEYNADDMVLASREAAALMKAGVQGLVFGAISGGALDRTALSKWVEELPTPRPSLTLHRAIDMLDDPVAAVDDALAIGFDRILTSGGQASAIDGAATIAAMTKRAAGRCIVMAGAGVAPSNVRRLIAVTAVSEVHSSASVVNRQDVPDRLNFGPLPRITSRNVVRALREAIDDKSNLGQL